MKHSAYLLLVVLLLLALPVIPVEHRCGMTGSEVCSCSHEASEGSCCSEVPVDQRADGVTIEKVSSTADTAVEIKPSIFSADEPLLFLAEHYHFTPGRDGPPLFLTVGSFLL